MVYFIIWEIHRSPHQFSIVKENATKPILWGKSGKLVLILFPYYGALSPVDSYFMAYFITWEMHVFHQFPITWEKTVKPIKEGNSGKLVPGNILQNPLYVENLENWYSYFSHSMGAFFHQIPILR